MYDIKNFLLGLGVGLILMSLLFYTLISINGQKLISESRSTMSNNDIVERAKSLGMIFVSELPKSNPQISDESIIQMATDLGMVFREVQEIYDDTSTNSEIQYISVDIPHGVNATQISEILHEHGIIDDVASYVDYLINKEITTELLMGEFDFPLNSDFDTITKVIVN